MSGKDCIHITYIKIFLSIKTVIYDFIIVDGVVFYIFIKRLIKNKYFNFAESFICIKNYEHDLNDK
jgi:hypothetical protein